MMKLRFFLTMLALLLLANLPLLADNWNFLDTERIGAKSFIAKYPTYNGQGVVIIILDTGIDLALDGLKHLPDGQVKIIDAQDFSGEGDVPIEQAQGGMENNEKYLKNSAEIKVFGYDKLAHQPVDSIYYIGIVKEGDFINTALPDLNNNENTTDQFPLLTFNSREGWLAYIDLDGDGTLADEEAIWNYKEKFQSFQFRGRNPAKNRNLSNFALNIFPSERKVNFHFDGNGHGSHVAGIAAGYRINGQEGLNGIAPAAKIISLKIGDGQLSGGATVTGSMIKAFEYGVEFSKHYNGAVVFNLSYGIGSEIEGQADMDLMLDQLLTENERLVICSSAGNEGPGISSVGLPAAAKRILSVGAIYTPFMSNHLYGSKISSDVITRFSSRGGEVNKPDVVAPGAAASTIPPYSTSEVKGGTSMASPQAAGAVALVMSAAIQQNPKLPIVGALIKRAMKNAADPLPEYLTIEQGGGVINVSRAFEFYKAYLSKEKYASLLDYDINTISPVYESESGPTAYWRFGNYAPGPSDKQTFFITPVFAGILNADQKHEFYRGFDLVVSAPWIQLSKNATYIKGEKAASVEVYFDSEKLLNPGIYNGKIIAYQKNGFRADKKARDKEFELICTVIKPLTFDQKNSFRWNSAQLKLGPGQIRRFFFKIPEQASAGLICLKADRSQLADVYGYLFDPSGREKDRTVHLNTDERTEAVAQLVSGDLQPGTWELVLYSDFRKDRPSSLLVEISFSGLEPIPQEIQSVTIDAGSDPRGTFTIVNHYDNKVEALLGGELQGIERIHRLSESSDHYEYAFTVGDLYEWAEFELELDAATYNLMTDFAINIKDYSGKTLQSDGLNYRKHKLTWKPPSAGDYLLELRPGFAKKNATPWQAILKETHHFSRKLPVRGGRYDFYPGLKKEVDFTINGALIVAPDQFHLFGEVWLEAQGKEKFRTVIPLKLYTGLTD